MAVRVRCCLPDGLNMARPEQYETCCHSQERFTLGVGELANDVVLFVFASNGDRALRVIFDFPFVIVQQNCCRVSVGEF